jgi:hypothetical protein
VVNQNEDERVCQANSPPGPPPQGEPITITVDAITPNAITGRPENEPGHGMEREERLARSLRTGRITDWFFADNRVPFAAPSDASFTDAAVDAPRHSLLHSEPKEPPSSYSG